MGEAYLRPSKKAKVSDNLKRAVWDLYVGIGVQRTLCQLCMINTIHSNINSGFECAHIVARKYLTEDATIYYLYPSCDVCNNQCRDVSIFDFLWARQRYTALRRLCMAVHTTYVTEHDAELATESRMIHLVLDHLYGTQRFRIGGGIVNRKQIYEVARIAQYDWLLDKSVELEKQLLALHQQRKMLMEAEIKPNRLV